MFYVEKDGGCDHMFCSRCQENWNWTSVRFDDEVGDREVGYYPMDQEFTPCRGLDDDPDDPDL